MTGGPIDWDVLISAARSARERAYAPYSGFLVGAALLDESGLVHVGSNVENASYGLTVCAERSAVFAAVSSGARRFRALAVVTGISPPATPCGACRQVLREFAPDLVIVTANLAGERVATNLPTLLPDSFGPDAIEALGHRSDC